MIRRLLKNKMYLESYCSIKQYFIAGKKYRSDS